ncbi:transcriptional regulator [Salmonella enterica subsp. enterica serovar Utah]|nr:transcriptional regulator [Salmonella enterica subsp. enterica serovar Utah]EDU8832771.1 transcriptional regulator [Salmonella enterica subsp. enterica]EEC4933353.1 transcriptional regulator [Salmonella enterica subsp. enterica serovar Kasenyi]EEC4937781.1 transcriptional regulator [Salmonella enterica subsp. enterica serovar Kasenyi]EEP8448524.1 transcriptional regulator [Salmonella enterica subsp. enterica serovar Kasenyi]
MKMKEQDLFEDLRDDSVLEYLHDYQEKTAYPALLSELNALLRKELARIGANPDHSLELVVAICRHIGGMQVYVPRGHILENLIRDMRIWRDFNGRNIPELVKRYRVTYKTVYKAIKRMRRLERNKYQPDLFYHSPNLPRPVRRPPRRP